MKNIILTVSFIFWHFSFLLAQSVEKKVGNNLCVYFPSDPNYNSVYGMNSYFVKTSNCAFISLVQENAIPFDTYYQLTKYTSNKQEPVISKFLDGYVESKLSTAGATLLTSNHIKIGNFLGLEISYRALNPATAESGLRVSRMYFISNTVYCFECWYLNNSSDCSIEKNTFFKSIKLKQ